MTADPEQPGDDNAPNVALPESLNEALDDLEHMLDGRQMPSATAVPSEGSPSAEKTPPIPVLEDVVVLGQDVKGDRDELDLYDIARRRVAERLASEIDVIVNAELEMALKRACANIRRRVHEHIDIILPEILNDSAEDPAESD